MRFMRSHKANRAIPMDWAGYEHCTRVLRNLPQDRHTVLANVYDGPCYRRAAEAIEEQSSGGHADELETSILLAIDRRFVNLDEAATWTPPTMATSGPFSRKPNEPRYSPAGVWGDPMLATEEKGHRLLSAMADDLLALLQ